jgi:hypothetical protein
VGNSRSACSRRDRNPDPRRATCPRRCMGCSPRRGPPRFGHPAACHRTALGFPESETDRGRRNPVRRNRPSAGRPGPRRTRPPGAASQPSWLSSWPPTGSSVRRAAATPQERRPASQAVPPEARSAGPSPRCWSARTASCRGWGPVWAGVRRSTSPWARVGHRFRQGGNAGFARSRGSQRSRERDRTSRRRDRASHRRSPSFERIATDVPGGLAPARRPAPMRQRRRRPERTRRVP